MITTENVKAVLGLIQERFPGKQNSYTRAVLQRQLALQIDNIMLSQPDAPTKVRLGYGILFISGFGDANTQRFNLEVNKALGL